MLKSMQKPADATVRSEINFPDNIRVSMGTAIALGLMKGKLDAEPTTAYLMTYYEGRCSANCSFCPQARTSTSKAELLSRITWPIYPSENVLEALKKIVSDEKIQRICVQALDFPNVFKEICAFVKELKTHVTLPISVSCQPHSSEDMWLLAEAGIDRIGVALDAATESLFNKVKGNLVSGPHKWQDVHKFLRVAIGVFGEGNVSTHLIVGLGETEKEIIYAIQESVDMGVLPALFAFTPIKGTGLASCQQPALDVYRRVQLARYLIVNGKVRAEDMHFDNESRLVDFGACKSLLITLVESGLPFLTSGCSNCNRPFYNEKPSGPLYNYPRSIRSVEMKMIKRELKL